MSDRAMTGINRRLLGSFSAGDLSVLPQMAPRPVISKVRFLGLSLDLGRPRSPNFGGGFFKGKGKRESFQHMRFSLVNDTPWKINMEPENDGLEDDFSFSIGWFLGSMLIFQRVTSQVFFGERDWSKGKFHSWNFAIFPETETLTWPEMKVLVRGSCLDDPHFRCRKWSNFFKVVHSGWVWSTKSHWSTAWVWWKYVEIHHDQMAVGLQNRWGNCCPQLQKEFLSNCHVPTM